MNVNNPDNQGVSIVNEVNAYTANQLARIHERIEGLRPGSVGRLAGLTIDFTNKNETSQVTHHTAISPPRTSGVTAAPSQESTQLLTHRSLSWVTR
jgi:hypothetical protein